MLKAFAWDEIDNELEEMTRENFLAWLRSPEAWPIEDLHEDGTLEFRSERGHTGFATYAPSIEEAHAKLLKHARYLEYNETEA